MAVGAVSTLEHVRPLLGWALATRHSADTDKTQPRRRDMVWETSAAAAAAAAAVVGKLAGTINCKPVQS